MSKDLYGFSVMREKWQYRQVITFDGQPFVLFEKVKLLAGEDKHSDPRTDAIHEMATGELRLQPLDEAVDEESKKKLVERTS